MTMLVLGVLFFIGIHLGLAGTRLRDKTVATFGEAGYSIGFSAASLVGIYWMVKAYQAAPYVATWGPLEAWKPVAIVLMLPAFLLAVIGVTTPNPTAVAQDARIGDVPRGIVRVTRHPFLLGVGIFALVHLVGNGDVASLMLFGGIAIVACAGTLSIDAKRRRRLGAATWDPFAAKTSILPFAAILAGRNRFNATEIAPWQWAVAILAYGLMLGGHSHIIGMSPFPA